VRVLVTGASGFLGHDVHALVRRAGSQPPDTTPVSGELTDAVRLTAAVTEVAPDAVVHLAAEIASQRSAERIRRQSTWRARAG